MEWAELQECLRDPRDRALGRRGGTHCSLAKGGGHACRPKPQSYRILKGQLTQEGVNSRKSPGLAGIQTYPTISPHQKGVLHGTVWCSRDPQSEGSKDLSPRHNSIRRRTDIVVVNDSCYGTTPQPGGSTALQHSATDTESYLTLPGRFQNETGVQPNQRGLPCDTVR